jgi:pheromone shutdown protein TraB
MNEHEGPVYEIPQWVLDSGLLNHFDTLTRHPFWLVPIVILGVVIVIIGRPNPYVAATGYTIAGAGMLALIGALILHPDTVSIVGALLAVWIILCTALVTRRRGCA